MAITINSNVASLQTQRQLAKVTAEVGGVFERLSSGLRITRARDDAAGLSISSDLKATGRVFSQGVRNFNDGLGLLNIADSAIEQLSTIVTRLKELAEQSANGIYGGAQRVSLDREAQALSREFTRIVQTTSFNGRQLLTANFGEVRIQGGFGNNGGIRTTLGGTVGTGSFGAQSSYLASSDIFGVGAGMGDVNGDGFLDIVTGSYDGSNSTLKINLGRGDGTFTSGATYAAHQDIGGSAVTYSVKLGDMNNDGILDIVATGNEAMPESYPTTMIRLGRGDGTFGASQSFRVSAANGVGVPGAALSSAIGDINGDGNIDVLVGGWYNSIGQASVLFGNGDGTLRAPQTYTTASASSTAYQVALADLNRDGNLDMVLSGSNVDSAFSIRLGLGGGSFGGVISYEMEPTNGTDGGTISVAVGDLNNDGILDIATAGSNTDAEGTVTIRFGNGDGQFGVRTTYLMDSFASRDLKLDDLNGDGALDIITSGDDGSGAVTTTVRLGNGNGTFGLATSTVINGVDFAPLIFSGDLNNDGASDLLVTTNFVAGSGLVTALGATTAGTSALRPFSLATKTEALLALTSFDGAQKRLSQQRGAIGAFQSRIETAISTLQIGIENYATAASRITDADVAEESAQLVRGRILQQAATSILGQANTQPQLALLLIGS